MPSLTDYGFSKFNRKDTTDIALQSPDPNYFFSDLGINGEKVENLSVSKLKAGSIGVSEYIQSTGFVSGTTGWRISGDGSIEAKDLALTGGTIKYGKTAFDDTTNAGYWMGATGLHYGEDATHYFKYTIGGSLEFKGGSVTNPVLTGIQTGSEIAIQGWQQDMTFSATDYRVVAWTSGTITLLDGTTYSITGANTGNMSALTYIYLDIATSTTLLQTTTTAANAVGSGKILIAVAEDNSDTAKYATYQVFGGAGGIKPIITADNIVSNAITANEILANTITASQIAASTITATEISTGLYTQIDADLPQDTQLLAFYPFDEGTGTLINDSSLYKNHGTAVGYTTSSIEDFTDYTEVDPNNRFTETSTVLTFTGLTGLEDAYVYIDKGANYFSGDFVHSFEFTISAQGNDNNFCPWMLSNDLDDFRGLDTGSKSFLYCYSRYNSGVRVFYIGECDSGTLYFDNYTGIELDRTYYIIIRRDESIGTYGTLYCYLYSNPERTNLIDILTVTLHTSKKDFRYLFGINSDNSGDPTTATGTIANLDITYSADWTVGVSGQSLDFNGISNYVSIDDLITTCASNTTGSISCWVNLDVDDGLVNTIFSVSRDADLGESEFAMTADWRTTSNRFYMWLAIDATRQFEIRTATNSLTPYIGEWLHIVVVQDGVEPKVYFNGVEQDITIQLSTDTTKWFKAIITDATNKADTANIGVLEENSTNYNFFDGKIDEFRIYNTALTAKQVYALYKNPAGIPSKLALTPQLTSGAILSRQIQLGTWIAPADDNDTFLSSGKNDFSTTTNGFILGIDATDGFAKLYLGNTIDYLYWDGTDLSFSGQLNAPIGILGQFDPALKFTCYGIGTGNRRIGCNFNTSEASDDTYLYFAGRGDYEDSTYELWKFQFDKGIWKVINKVATSVDHTDIAGVVKCESYVYIGEDASGVWRYDADDLANEQEMSVNDIPADYDFPAGHNGMATDGTYIYIIGEYNVGNGQVWIGKFSIDGTDLNYESKFLVYSNGTGDYFGEAVLGCDGTYLYLPRPDDPTSKNKMIRRFDLDGSNPTDFDYMGSPYPTILGSEYNFKRDLILGVFRILNKWWIVEYYWRRMTTESGDETIDDIFTPYFKQITF